MADGREDTTEERLAGGRGGRARAGGWCSLCSALPSPQPCKLVQLSSVLQIGKSPAPGHTAGVELVFELQLPESKGRALSVARPLARLPMTSVWA